jgi:hypothetical protein
MAHYYSTTVKLTAANTLYPRRVYMENHKAYLVLTRTQATAKQKIAKLPH